MCDKAEPAIESLWGKIDILSQCRKSVTLHMPWGDVCTKGVAQHKPVVVQSDFGQDLCLLWYTLGWSIKDFLQKKFTDFWACFLVTPVFELCRLISSNAGAVETLYAAFGLELRSQRGWLGQSN